MEPDRHPRLPPPFSVPGSPDRSSSVLPDPRCTARPRWRAVAVWTLLLAASPAAGDDVGSCLARAAREQVGVTTGYDGTYVRLRYPGGDVPMERGVCTDVVVRACRRLGVDLQEAVHEDMKRAFASYPRRWGLSRPDPNIDHRRVANLATFFTRHGRTIPVSTDPSAWQPGDFVTFELPSGFPHIGIVSDRPNGSKVPLVIHNVGGGTREEDVLLTWRITGHWRYRPEAFEAACGTDPGRGKVER